MSRFQLPPHNLESERVVLAAMMLREFPLLVPNLRTEHFFSVPHQTIFDVAQQLRTNDQPYDLPTIADQLSQAGSLEDVGGFPYLIQVHESAPSGTIDHSSEYHSKRVVDLWADRAAQYAANEANSGRMDRAELRGELDTIESQVAGNHVVSLQDAVEQFDEEFDKPRKCVSTGFHSLDALFDGGFEAGQLIVLAARPGCGKSAFATSLMSRMSQAGLGVLLCSLEMTANEVVERMVSARSGVKLSDIRRRKITASEQEQRAMAQSEMKISTTMIDDTSVRFREIAAQATRYRSTTDMLIVDYLQLVKGDDPKAGREQEVASISRGLKQLAKKLEIPIVALAQLNRKIEERKGGVPLLSDLRESGSIEQDANVVMFLHQSDEEKPSEINLIVAKSRNGSTGIVPLSFQRQTTCFQPRSTQVDVSVADQFEDQPADDGRF